MNDTQRFTLFRKDLLLWFAENRRPLPWRADYTPYRTWIAEVMMQQTQMDRGVQYFLRWMERFPDVAAVAAAPEEDLLKAWEGLGYYRRARNIQAAARVIMERHGGNFPTSYADILALPGVGPYTAGAIASTAYNEEVPCVDGNVERVLSRVFDIDTPVKEEPAKWRKPSSRKARPGTSIRGSWSWARSYAAKSPSANAARWPGCAKAATSASRTNARFPARKPPSRRSR